MGFNRSQAAVAYVFSLSTTEYIINEFGVAAVRLTFEGLAKGMGLDEVYHQHCTSPMPTSKKSGCFL